MHFLLLDGDGLVQILVRSCVPLHIFEHSLQRVQDDYSPSLWKTEVSKSIVKFF